MTAITDVPPGGRALADRLEIAELVSRLYTLLDEQRFDELGSVCTDDVRLEMPSGRMHGSGRPPGGA